MCLLRDQIREPSMRPPFIREPTISYRPGPAFLVEHRTLACVAASGLFRITVLMSEALLRYKSKKDRLRTEDAVAFLLSFVLYSLSILSSCVVKCCKDILLLYKHENIGCSEWLRVWPNFFFASIVFFFFLCHFFVSCRFDLAAQIPKQKQMRPSTTRRHHLGKTRPLETFGSALWL